MAGNREERSPCRGDFGRRRIVLRSAVPLPAGRREDLERIFGKPFRKTRDISDFSAQCLEIDPSLHAILTKAEPSRSMPGAFAIRALRLNQTPRMPPKPSYGACAARTHRNAAERLLLRRGNCINGHYESRTRRQSAGRMSAPNATTGRCGGASFSGFSPGPDHAATSDSSLPVQFQRGGQ